MIPRYDLLVIGVITESKDTRKYFNLFKFLLEDKTIMIRYNNNHKSIDTKNVSIRFIPKLNNVRGYKFHFVLNLTQDEEYHNCVALPTTVIEHYLQKDPRWSQLFEGVE